jgi:Zn-dependent M28 family amino/carboxypeptidase
VTAIALATTPGQVLLFDIRAPGATEHLRDLGIETYGMTDNYLLAPATPAARAALIQTGMPVSTVALTGNEPAYLVWSRNAAHLDELGGLLFRDGNMALVQADAATALSVSRQGFQLIALPDKPRPVLLPTRLDLPHASFADTFVQRLVNEVNADSIRRQIQRLQDFQTRFSPTDSCRSAEQYVFDYFTALGLDSVALDSYPEWGDTWRNVVGTRVGTVDPTKVIVICGHLDCTSEDPDNNAPGAEDNASGTAMAIEAARIMAQENPEITLKFIAFTGEEQGIYGSFHYAEMMRNLGINVLGALNFDMIAWPGGYFGTAIFCNRASLPLAQYEDEMAGLYTTLDHGVVVGSYGSDQLAFHAYGYAGTAGAEYGDFYPYYHTTADTIGFCSMALAAEVAKMGLATMASLSVIPGPPDSFQLWDAGAGGTLFAQWRANTEPDLVGYRLFWGTDSLALTDSTSLGLVTSHYVSGLQNGTRYYAKLRAIDAAGHPGLSSPIRSAVPNAVPLAPASPAALPFWYGMRLTWQRNVERDLVGYNLYRSTTTGGGYVRLNSSVLTDSVYRDSTLLPDTMYYYIVAAIDTGAQESNHSTEVSGKPITLDHGVLLVDETRDGVGTPGNPSDAQVDAFYHSMLHGFSYTDWDVRTQGVPLAGDIGPYSTVVWHADDFQDLRILPAVPGLANYLAHGGRLWLTGWKPVYGLMGGTGHYPYTFTAGKFPYDYLHLSGASESPPQDFVGASGKSGYPDLTIDSAKMLPSMRGRLPFVDAFVLRDAETTLTFNSFSGDSFQGRPIGVRWLNAPGRVVFFGFPFYYAKDAEARPVALKVMQDLGEPYAVEEAPPMAPAASRLDAPGPNPFSSRTGISFTLTRTGPVRLAVYDAAGQLVRVLAQGSFPAGPGRLTWDGCDARGRQLAPGIYFCRLSASGFVATRKLELSY